MKKIILFLIIELLILKFTIAQSPWVQMPNFTNDNLYSGKSFQGECLVFGSNSGVKSMWRSTDGGQNWMFKNILYNGVAFLTPERWIGADYSTYTFYLTPDSGNTWQHLPFLDGRYWSRFSFNSYSIIAAHDIPDWPTNDTVYLYLSIDNFNTYNLYKKLNVDTFALQNNIFPIYLLDSLLIYKFDDGKLYKSVNAGNSWSYLSDLSYNSKMYFFNQNLGFYIDQGNFPNQLYRTTDGGQTWSLVLANPTSILLDFVICKNMDTCYAFGNNMIGDKRIYRSINGGLNWQTSQNFANNINSLVITDSMGVFAFGNSGLYIRSNSISALFENSDVYFSNLSLFPNPNTGQFTIIVQTLNEQEQLQLSVTDVYGKQILNQQIVNSVNHSIDLSAYSKGIYYVSVTGNSGFREVKKVVVN
ncbi:MAG: T9SS type A sorting domain-containing protein [Bacteroidia bacterium]